MKNTITLAFVLAVVTCISLVHVQAQCGVREPIPDRAALEAAVDDYFAFGTSATYGPIGDWCVEEIEDFSELFASNRIGFTRAGSFNADISRWNTKSATTMSGMFSGARAFNQPIGDWNVESVKDMSYMFSGAVVFNQPIGDWNVEAVEDMSYMFIETTAFNQPIGDWNVISVTNMVFMFFGATAFNQPIGDWSVESVEDMSYMFNIALQFSQNLCMWGSQIGSTSTEEMFAESGCPETGSPDFTKIPPGPFCFKCELPTQGPSWEPSLVPSSESSQRSRPYFPRSSPPLSLRRNRA